MAIFLLKPILWNTKGYVVPSGVPASAESYPGKYGFGHEEWNNSPKMAFIEHGQRFRAFHTEGIKRAPVEEHAGQTFVFMTASHNGIQELVGVAGNAIYIGDEQHDEERIRIAKLLDIKDFRRDAWELPSVQRLFGADPKKFKKYFNQSLNWVPNWICPAEFFMWFEEPVTLDPQRIVGSNRLPTMFSCYKALEREAVSKIMNSIPKAQRTKVWERLLDAVRSAPEAPVVSPSLNGDDGTTATTRLTNILARVGQGEFRDRLMEKWDRSCAVTGLTCPELLRASHVKPWSDSRPRERLDPNNGLLLAAHLDALFDKGLISFDDAGKMLMSSRLLSEERKHFSLPLALRLSPNAALKAYLAYHRDRKFDRA